MHVSMLGAVVVVGAAWLCGLLWPLIYVAVAVLTAVYTVQWNLVRGKMYQPPPAQPQLNVASVLLQKMMERESDGGAQAPVSRKSIISRSLDNALQEVLELVCRDFILNWYQDISADHTTLITTVLSEMWVLVDNISSRLSNIDVVTVATQDVVEALNDHFKAIRLAQKREGEGSEETQTKFLLHPWLRDEEREVECLRHLTETLLLLLLPAPYARCDSHRHLLREIIATSVFQVTIDMLCDPDYINGKILSYIRQQEKLMADTKRTYTYAASYEDFVKMINVSQSPDELKQMRYKIISEIMQATTINNLKKAQGINTDKESSPKSTAKGELLKARNLKRYINQLTVAKQLVEKRMQILGGGGGSTTSSPGSTEENLTLPGQKVLSFAVVMEKPKAREYFMHFLEQEGNDFMLGFCIEVEALRVCNKVEQHQMGTEVYQQFVVKCTRTLPVDKATIKGMETFLRGDGGPEAFFEADRQVREELEKQHYHSFLVSDLYHQYISTLHPHDSPHRAATTARGEEAEDEEEDLDNLSIVSNELFLDDKEEEEEEELLADQSYHARQLLRQLDAKITNKTQAMQALLSSQKLEKEKVKKLHEDLEREVEKMRVEQKELETHIQRTKLWTDNIGRWKVHVVTATVEVEEDRKVAQFVLLVSLNPSRSPQSPGASSSSAPPEPAATPTITIPRSPSDSKQGWAVQRSLEDIHALHEKLSQIGPWLQKKDLPSQSRGPFRSMDAAYLDRAKSTLNDYLSAVMQDERMIHSEALYAFFAPSPQFLHHPSSQTRNKFSVNILKRGLPSLRTETQDDDDFLFFNEDSAKDDRSHDSIAKPLYSLLGEVFELRGMFKLVRRTFMTFVELTFGSNINRQLREMVRWTYSEQMLLFYIRTFKESMWPGGKLVDTPPTKTDSQKFETRMAAKKKLVENIPDAVKTLVGEDNARRGTIKVFEVLQNKTLNKHLVYNLLQIVLLELCPELKKTRQSLMEAVQQQSAQAIS